MEMKKQAMNCAFTAMQEEELLRECAAFYRSSAVCLYISRSQKVNGTSGDFPGHLSAGKGQLLPCHIS